MSTPSNFPQHFLDEAKSGFGKYKLLGEKAFAQMRDEDFHARPDPESNSAAVIIRHMEGNMISRWTKFLDTDGEKPDRNRDIEFIENETESRRDLLARWERGWNAVFAAIDELRDDDILRIVTIRGEPHTVIQAINRQLLHYAYHVGQIVYIAKHLRSREWKTLSIAKKR